MTSTALATQQIIIDKIIVIRGEKVMFDFDVAELYGVETKRLKEAVRRNKNRFPKDFMFELSKKEWQNLRSQFASSSWGGIRYPPMVFTEHGAVMLASVLNTSIAVNTSIQVVRAFVKLREIIATHKELAKKLEELEKKYDKQFKVVFEAIKQLMGRLSSQEGRLGLRERRRNEKNIGSKLRLNLDISKYLLS